MRPLHRVAVTFASGPSPAFFFVDAEIWPPPPVRAAIRSDFDPTPSACLDSADNCLPAFVHCNAFHASPCCAFAR